MYTPGPWKNEKAYYGEGATADIIRTVGEHKTCTDSMSYITIAHMDRVMFAREDSDEVKEMKANARLIAAAPDLLDACKGVMNMLNGEFPLHPMSEKVRAAINKAEGKKSVQD